MDIPPISTMSPPFDARPHSTWLHRGVEIPHPASVFIDEDVLPEQIAPGVVLHPGTRLSGPNLRLGPGCVIGGEGPATLVDCVLGHDVALKGGFFKGSVFLDESVCGSAAHVRPGCLLEEAASIAHGVGIKQTILFPFVTLGSLINFCDVLMAGGTDGKNHSEVGSSFVHFNFTPLGDKATASLLGDVPRGVLLDQAPIFLGGQGGMVGPVQAEFGVIQAAGGICRAHMTQAGHLYRFPGCTGEAPVPYSPGSARDPFPKLDANLMYLGNLMALRSWYQGFRAPIMAADLWRAACCTAAVHLLTEAMDERLRQMGKWVAKLDQPEKNPAVTTLCRQWPGILDVLKRECRAEPPVDAGLTCLGEAAAAEGLSVIEAVRRLTPEAKQDVLSTLTTEVQRICSVRERVQ